MSSVRPTDEQVARWYPRLYRTALRLTGRFADAADVTQEAFSKALASWDRFDGGVLPTTWLHTILVNCVRDWARRQRARPSVRLEPWALAAPDGDAGDGRLARQEELAALRAAVEDLSEPLRQAFVATVIDGYRYEEAAEMLGVPVGTVASRVYQARAKVRDAVLHVFGGVQ